MRSTGTRARTLLLLRITRTSSARTLGFPIWKNKPFYFGDIEANRISISNPDTDQRAHGAGAAGRFLRVTERQPHRSGRADPTLRAEHRRPRAASGLQWSAECVSARIKSTRVAQNILNLYPAPNANGGKLYNNYLVNVGNSDNTVQWDQRLDWNLSAKDQSYVRYSYLHEVRQMACPLGPILDGSGYGGQYDTNLAMNFMGSETHIFTPIADQ